MSEYLPRRRRVGGLRIDPRKSVSTAASIAPVFIPSHLHIPVESRFGVTPDICVAVGQQVQRGEILAAAKPGSAAANVHASSSGRVAGIDSIDVTTVHGDRSVPAVVIETDGRHTPVDPRPRPPGLEDRAQCFEFIRSSGIVGLGGAAVSTGWKLAQAPNVKTLIINGAECEPYISCDDMLMREQPGDILAGSRTLCDLTGAQLCIVAIERDKPKAIESIRQSMESLEDDRLHLAELPSIYPAGGERQLVELLIGEEVPSGRYPADMGILCQNVGTASAVHHALHNGEPLLSRIVTLTGNGMRRPGNVTALIGTRLSDLIEHHGGFGDDAAALIIGGSMMGVAQTSDAGVVSKWTNCVLVPDGEEFGDAPRTQWPCIRCGECAGACPARLLPQEMLRGIKRQDFGMLETLGLVDCIECGCCDAICPSHIPLTHQFVEARLQLRQRRNDRQFAETAQARFDTRSERMTEFDDRLRADQEELRSKVASPDAGKRAIEAVLRRANARRRDDKESQ